jgi:hypothetical protein
LGKEGRRGEYSTGFEGLRFWGEGWGEMITYCSSYGVGEYLGRELR